MDDSKILCPWCMEREIEKVEHVCPICRLKIDSIEDDFDDNTDKYNISVACKMTRRFNIWKIKNIAIDKIKILKKRKK